MEEALDRPPVGAGCESEESAGRRSASRAFEMRRRKTFVSTNLPPVGREAAVFVVRCSVTLTVVLRLQALDRGLGRRLALFPIKAGDTDRYRAQGSIGIPQGKPRDVGRNAERTLPSNSVNDLIRGLDRPRRRLANATISILLTLEIDSVVAAQIISASPRSTGTGATGRARV